MTPAPGLRRVAQWTGGTLAALLASLVLLAIFFDWNLARGFIERRVSVVTGRSFSIHGDLDVRLSLRPRVVAYDVVLGNVPGAADPVMAQARRIEFRIDLPALLAGRIALPDLTVSQPRLALAVNADGVGNWTFQPGGTGAAARPWSVGALSIDEGRATYRDAAGTDLQFTLQTVADSGPASPFGVELTGTGRFKALPLVLSARGGALLSLREAHDPYPVQAKASIGNTRLSIDGLLLDPLRMKGEKLNVTLAGSDLALLFPLIGVPLPATGPYQLAGFLDHAGDVWSLRNFKGRLGQSDLSGDFSVDRGRQPQRVEAALVSRMLVLQDLAGFIGAKVQPAAAAAPRTTFLAAEPFRVDRLMAADVDVRLRADQVVTAGLPLERMKANLVIKGGVVRLAPLEFGVAGGSLVSQIEMDGRQPRMRTKAQITAKALRLNQMFKDGSRAAAGTGTMGGQATLTGSGNSVAGMLATADGQAALIMEGGSVGELALRMSNLDIANSLLLVLGGDKQVAVRCMAGRFEASAGKFEVRTLVMDTAKVQLVGTGHVDFADESLHLTLASQSKGFSLASLRGPIAVTGTFLAPRLRPQLHEGLLRGGLALALGAATGGFGALLPLLDVGGAKDSDCAALVGQARGQLPAHPADAARSRTPAGTPAR